MTGTVKKSLQFSGEVEGVPQFIDVGGATLVTSTSKQMLKLWNVARNYKKLFERRFENAKTGEKYGTIASIR